MAVFILFITNCSFFVIVAAAVVALAAAAAVLPLHLHCFLGVNKLSLPCIYV